MGKYVSSKEFIEMGVLSIALLMIFIHSLIQFIVFMKYRRKFYEDYISCFQSKDNNLGIKITGLIIRFLLIIIMISKGKYLRTDLVDFNYLEKFWYVMGYVALISVLVLDLLSAFIHMRTDYGISAEYISTNSLIIPKDKVVYDEYENEVIIYRKSKKKEKGVKLASQAYDSNNDQKFLDYVHTYYQKVN
ncbi:hypothetical protein [Anaerosporobacter sp.]